MVIKEFKELKGDFNKEDLEGLLHSLFMLICVETEEEKVKNLLFGYYRVYKTLSKIKN